MGRSGMIRLVGVEIGGTKQQVAVGTAQGEILDRRTVRLGDKTSARDILMWLEDNIREIMDRWEIGGIGVGFGGPLELGRGRVLCSLQVPGWMDFRLKEWFEERFGVPSVIVNDTVLGGIGELVLGRGEQPFFLYQHRHRDWRRPVPGRQILRRVRVRGRLPGQYMGS